MEKRITTKLLVDTGSPSALHLWETFFDQQDLPYTHRTIESLHQVTLDGKEMAARVGRVESIRLGSYIFENVITKITTNSDWSRYFDGIIGGEILRRFSMAFDYERQRIFLVSNRNFQEPFEYDMSGLSLVSRGSGWKTIEVVKVNERTPAAEAGVQEGDLIEAINGESSEELTLEVIRDLFQRKNEKIFLVVKRRENAVRIAFTTKRLI